MSIFLVKQSTLDLEADPIDMRWSIDGSNPDLLYACDWEGKLNCWQLKSKFEMRLRPKFEFSHPEKHFFLSIEELDQNHLILSCSDRVIYIFDLQQQKLVHRFVSNEASFKIFYRKEQNLVYSMNFNRELQLHDIRTNQYIYKHTFRSPIIAGEYQDPYVAIATGNDNISLFDIRNFEIGSTFVEYPIGLNSSTSCLGLNNDKLIAVGKNNGEVVVLNSKQEGRYAFDMKRHSTLINTSDSVKLHLQSHSRNIVYEGENQKVLFPIHTAKFHPKISSILFTTGGDGTIRMIDVESEISSKYIKEDPFPITHLSFHQGGELVAIVQGDDMYEYISYTTPQATPKIKILKINFDQGAEKELPIQDTKPTSFRTGMINASHSESNGVVFDKQMSSGSSNIMNGFHTTNELLKNNTESETSSLSNTSGNTKANLIHLLRELSEENYEVNKVEILNLVVTDKIATEFSKMVVDEIIRMPTQEKATREKVVVKLIKFLAKSDLIEKSGPNHHNCFLHGVHRMLETLFTDYRKKDFIDKYHLGSREILIRSTKFLATVYQHKLIATAVVCAVIKYLLQDFLCLHRDFQLNRLKSQQDLEDIIEALAILYDEVGEKLQEKEVGRIDYNC